ncbi:MAG: zinc ABC transporter substrate-binding protein [Ignavibacteria bacterium]|nr:zinc ABC transporter substrate-binding protein [Ignavibacteria bacterium]
MLNIKSCSKYILFPVLTLSIISCKEKNENQRTDKILAVSSITIIADMVKYIGGDKVDSRSICPVGTDPHTYKPKPSDPKSIAESDIVFINGLGLEHWIEEMIRNAGGNKKVVKVTDGIEPLKDEKGYGDPDPHAWFDVNLAKIYVRNIADALAEVDKPNELYYLQNLNDYLLKLDSLDSWIRKQIAEIPEMQRVLITSHDAFRYFGRAYGLEVRGLQGISTEARPQTEDIKKIVDLIKERKLKAVFIETSVNPKLLQEISRETSARVGGTLYSDSLGEEYSDEGTYIGAVIHNVKTITSALK